MATAEQWLAKMAELRVDRATRDPAPHKPLLLLTILDYAERISLYELFGMPVPDDDEIARDAEYRAPGEASQRGRRQIRRSLPGRSRTYGLSQSAASPARRQVGMA